MQKSNHSVHSQAKQTTSIRIRKTGQNISLVDLGPEMTVAFGDFYNKYFPNVIPVQSLNPDLVEAFNDFCLARCDDSDFHSPANDFFNNFTPLNQIYLSASLFAYAESLWKTILKIAADWEERNPSKPRIHKGTPCYFAGVANMLGGDIEEAIAFMFQGVKEDERTTGSRRPDLPGVAFIELNDQKQDQYFKMAVDQAAGFLREKLHLYASHNKGTLKFDEFREKFLKNPDLEDAASFFLVLIFKFVKSLQEDITLLKDNPLVPQLMANMIFDLTQVCDEICRPKTGGRYMSDHVNFIASKLGWQMKTAVLNPSKGYFDDQISNHFSNIVSQLTNGTYVMSGILASLSRNECDFALTYGLRNFGAHNLKSQLDLTDLFPNIIQSVMNSIFLSLEVLY